MKLTCYTTLFENWDFLKDTGIFSNERLEQVKSFCAADQYVPAKLEDGRVIKEWWVHKPTGRVFNKHAMEYADHYRNTEILSDFLTEQEIELINKQANKIISVQSEQRKFDKAEKILEKDWKGPVFYEGIGYNDGYFSDLNDFHDYVGNEEDIKYVWACDEEPSCLLNIYEIIENASQEAHDNFDVNNLRGYKELEEAVRKFNELNKGEVTWHPNFKKAVILD